MKNLSMQEQKQIVGGRIYKIFDEDGYMVAKATNETAFKVELANLDEGRYHIYIYQDNGDYYDDYWKRVN